MTKADIAISNATGIHETAEKARDSIAVTFAGARERARSLFTQNDEQVVKDSRHVEEVLQRAIQYPESRVEGTKALAGAVRTLRCLENEADSYAAKMKQANKSGHASRWDAHHTFGMDSLVAAARIPEDAHYIISNNQPQALEAPAKKSLSKRTEVRAAVEQLAPDMRARLVAERVLGEIDEKARGR